MFPQLYSWTQTILPSDMHEQAKKPIKSCHPHKWDSLATIICPTWGYMIQIYISAITGKMTRFQTRIA
jgi:hypothetical protein